MRNRTEGIAYESHNSGIGFLLASACISLLAGCTVGPNYHRPPVATAPAFQEPANANRSAGTSGHCLVQLVECLPRSCSRQLGESGHRCKPRHPDRRRTCGHRQRDGARGVHSQQLPTIGASPSISRTREAQQRPNNGNTYGQASTYNDLLLPLTLGYEIDAWGKIRRMVQSANATAQATDADLRFVRLSGGAVPWPSIITASARQMQSSRSTTPRSML